MDVISKPTRSTDPAETLISSHEIERQLSLNQTLYFCKLPPPTPHNLSLDTTPFPLCQRISLFSQFHALLLMHVLLRKPPKFDMPKDL